MLQEHAYGSQRAWASVGQGVTCMLAGQLIQGHGLGMGFLGHALLAVPCLAAAIQLQDTSSDSTTSHHPVSTQHSVPPPSSTNTTAEPITTTAAEHAILTLQTSSSSTVGIPFSASSSISCDLMSSKDNAGFHSVMDTTATISQVKPTGIFISNSDSISDAWPGIVTSSFDSPMTMDLDGTNRANTHESCASCSADERTTHGSSSGTIIRDTAPCYCQSVSKECCLPVSTESSITTTQQLGHTTVGSMSAAALPTCKQGGSPTAGDPPDFMSDMQQLLGSPSTWAFLCQCLAMVGAWVMAEPGEMRGQSQLADGNAFRQGLLRTYNTAQTFSAWHHMHSLM